MWLCEGLFGESFAMDGCYPVFPRFIFFFFLSVKMIALIGSSYDLNRLYPGIFLDSQGCRLHPVEEHSDVNITIVYILKYGFNEIYRMHFKRFAKSAQRL